MDFLVAENLVLAGLIGLLPRVIDVFVDPHPEAFRNVFLIDESIPRPSCFGIGIEMLKLSLSRSLKDFSLSLAGVTGFFLKDVMLGSLGTVNLFRSFCHEKSGSFEVGLFLAFGVMAVQRRLSNTALRW